MLRVATLIVPLAALPACAAPAARTTSPAAQVAPDVVARDFYGRYLRVLEAGGAPVRSETAPFKGLVSAAAWREARADRSGADYFLKAQDQLEDWSTHIVAAPPVLRGNTATTVITLGVTPASAHKLRVTLVRERGRWMIRRVADG